MTLPRTPADPDRLGGYEIVARLGTGGQGVVYLGRSRGGEVAIKLLHSQVLADAGSRARFVREVALLQRVAGFCTAQMIEADMAGDRPYIVSEYVPGPSLRELVDADGPRAGADLDRLAISSVTALTAIHRAGIVHRDFKPHNVLMGPDGPRVIDFGIARALDTDATLTGRLIGTPAYMAPEQFAGEAVGPAADLFAWALTLLFAATGRVPFDGPSIPAVMYRALHETPDVSVLPDEIAGVALACLHRDPAARPTAEEALLRLLRDNKPALDREPPTAPGGARYGSAPVPLQGKAAGARTSTRPEVPSGQGPATPPTQQTPPAPLDGRTRRSAPPPYEDSTTWSPPAQGRSDPAARPPAGGRGFGHGPLRRLRRTVPVVGGLVLAGLLAVLDVASLALLVARPELSSGPNGGLLPVVAASFVLLAVITLVGVVLAWRGSRAAAWTVMAVRVARVAMWGAWSALVTVEVSALTLHAGLTAVVVLLLFAGLRSP